MKNLGGGKFADVGLALGADEIRDARGVAVSDFDGDGDLDLAINHNPGVKDTYKEGIAPALLRNDIPRNKDGETAPNRNWLAVELEGGAGEDPAMANSDALGVEVLAEFKDGTKMFRHVVAGSGYAAQMSKRLHFGLGAHTEVERLEVRWKRPFDSVTELKNVTANQVIKIKQIAKDAIASASDGAE